VWEKEDENFLEILMSCIIYPLEGEGQVRKEGSALRLAG
jgi:hypothetical protein